MCLLYCYWYCSFYVFIIWTCGGAGWVRHARRVHITLNAVCAVANTPRVTSSGLVTASYDTFVYQLDGSASGAAPTIARQWKYATLTDTWVSIKAIPTSRAGGASGVATVGTKMYVLDGLLATGNKKNEAYDTTTDTWATKASTPTDHSKGAVGVKGNKIYVAGGPVTNKLEIYDASTDSWVSGTALALP
jgi:hypothetical protein